MKAEPDLFNDARYQLANRHQAARNWAEAEAALISLLADYPYNAELLERTADVLFRQEKYPAAADHLERLAVLQPRSARVHYYLGLARWYAGDPEAGRADFECALQLQPDFPEVHSAMSHMDLPGPPYYEILQQAHTDIRPVNYVEIGVETGKSLAYAHPPTLCIGIDPRPQINVEFSAPTRIFTETSDDFFRKYDLGTELGGRPVDLAFIDGLHLFEAALKDFINIERYASPETVVMFHDCIPLNEMTSRRDRVTTFWSGDTWKVIPCLRRYRPDLEIITMAAPPTGLAVVLGLDSRSTVLPDNLDGIVSECLSMDYDALAEDKHNLLNVSFAGWPAVLERIRARRGGSAS